MTEVQGEMTGIISLIAHPPEVLDAANAQHRRLLGALRRHDPGDAARVMAEHVRATEHILAGSCRRRDGRRWHGRSRVLTCAGARA